MNITSSDLALGALLVMLTWLSLHLEFTRIGMIRR